MKKYFGAWLLITRQKKITLETHHVSKLYLFVYRILWISFPRLFVITILIFMCYGNRVLYRQHLVKRRVFWICYWEKIQRKIFIFHYRNYFSPILISPTSLLIRLHNHRSPNNWLSLEKIKNWVCSIGSIMKLQDFSTLPKRRKHLTDIDSFKHKGKCINGI